MVLTARTRTRIGIACAVVVVGFLGLWFVGQEASADPTLQVPTLLERLYPGTWDPVARGILWIVAGAAAVGFDLLIARPMARSRAGRAGIFVAGILTGLCFLVFALGTFTEQGWSVIH